MKPRKLKTKATGPTAAGYFLQVPSRPGDTIPSSRTVHQLLRLREDDSYRAHHEHQCVFAFAYGHQHLKPSPRTGYNARFSDERKEHYYRRERENQQHSLPIPKLHPGRDKMAPCLLPLQWTPSSWTQGKETLKTILRKRTEAINRTASSRITGNVSGNHQTGIGVICPDGERHEFD